VRTATFVTARLGSSRLERKMLADLEGAPVLEHVVANLRRAETPDLLAVVTTTEPQDDELAALATSLGAEVFRGDVEDILVRWRDAARHFELDLFVNADGDDVMLDALHIDRVIAHMADTGEEYVTVAGLPFGTAPTGISVPALDCVCALKQETETAGQGRFFEDPKVARRGEIAAPPELRHDEARMTLDYPEDLEFFAAVVRELGMAPALADIVALLHARPDIVAINAARQEEYWRRFRELYPPVTLEAQP
jgi:spore coat polysaccharide biosynthesis protein SpsF (cytidylyltransferase family)